MCSGNMLIAAIIISMWLFSAIGACIIKQDGPYVLAFLGTCMVGAGYMLLKGQ